MNDTGFDRSLYRYRSACQKQLGSQAFSDEAWDNIRSLVRQSALTMSGPADLINVAIEKLNDIKIDLPAFSPLDRLISHERQSVHEELYLKIASALTPDERKTLDSLLQVTDGEQITGFAK